jgi:hypothetical protein
MWRHALDLLAPCSERPQRPRIDTERHRLAAAQPAAEVCPVIDRARSQYLGIARHEGAPDCPLCRPAADGSTDTMTRCERIGQAHGFARSDQCHLLGTVWAPPCSLRLLSSRLFTEQASQRIIGPIAQRQHQAACAAFPEKYHLFS